MKLARLLAVFSSLVALSGSPLPAQESQPAAEHVAPDSLAAAVGSRESQGLPVGTEQHGAPATAAEQADIITPHITDAPHIEYPCWGGGTLVCSAHLPQWKPVHIGGLTIDFSPTKHVVMLLIAGLLCCLVLIIAARAHERHTHEVGRPKGFAAGIEAMVLYIRNEVAIPNVGPHGEKFAPFIMTLFFFILFANLLGLIPYGSTATGNISVTLTLALITFVVVELAGMRAQGLHYLSTIFYWNKDLPIVMRVIMFVVMSPVELIGKFTKPFALTIRLFANMTAGHIVVLALIGLIFTFKSFVIGVAPALMATAIMVLELFVAFLQAYIFALLSAVFIGLIREGGH